jgi:hypothetical protein
MTERRLFQGRPRPSDRVLGFGISGSRVFHCSSVKSREWHIGVTHAVRLLHFGPIRGEPSRSGLRLKAPGTKKNRAENPNAYQRSTKGNSG